MDLAMMAAAQRNDEFVTHLCARAQDAARTEGDGRRRAAVHKSDKVAWNKFAVRLVPKPTWLG